MARTQAVGAVRPRQSECLLLVGLGRTLPTRPIFLLESLTGSNWHHGQSGRRAQEWATRGSESTPCFSRLSEADILGLCASAPENAKARAQRHVLGDPVMASIQSAGLLRGCIGQTRSRRSERPTPSLGAGRVCTGAARHSAMALSGSEIGVCPGSEIRQPKWRLDVVGTGRQPMSTAMATRGATAHISS